MKLHFTKRDGKYDALVIERDDGTTESIACPKQGIIPHDMVHYAVERVLHHSGFLSLVQQGKDERAAFGADSEEAIERLVETFQAEMWGGQVPAAGLIATYEHACEARRHTALSISELDIDKIRNHLETLTNQWSAVSINQTLTLEFAPR